MFKYTELCKSLRHVRFSFIYFFRRLWEKDER